MKLRDIQNVDESYRLDTGVVYVTGLQTLVRLVLTQSRLDQAAGLRTAGFISGYRGSPLGGLDRELWRARAFLDSAAIHFQPGLNEDLAATSVWGTQQVNLFPGARYDGVFGLWYGKGPGVDRSGDVFKHGNSAGSSRYGGVLVVAGDDHACKSSTLHQQSEYAFIDAMMPVLNPADAQDVLDLGLIGYALSRYSGCWVALKMTEDNADSSQTLRVGRNAAIVPPVFEMPDDGLHIRWPDTPTDQDNRLQRFKLSAALAFSRANPLNRIVIDSSRPRLGIVSTGKAYLDVLQALQDLGIDEHRAGEIGIRLLKVGMSWPLEPECIREFAAGLDEVLVVEEKRPVIEHQIKEQLYNCATGSRPVVVGKFDEQDEQILPSTGQLTPAQIARVIAGRLSRFYTSPDIEERLRFLDQRERFQEASKTITTRLPHFCSGCPHNTSTRVPEGSRAIAGIGCHYMAAWMDRETVTYTQMGGEGVTWIGQAPFTETSHVFQNLGDGTYTHSGLLAIRAAVAADVNITYKILYNDAVAMTGGQPVEGGFSVAQIARQLAAEGVEHTVVVTNELERYSESSSLPAGVAARHRRGLDGIQRDLRERRGVSALIYDQTCAAELRRRRRRGEAEDPDRWVTINPLVCEGCGDCNAVSNCLSVVPLETEFGRKRKIHQSACNKDFSCVEGFCPSFVTLEGVKLKKPQPVVVSEELPALPEPERAAASPCNVLISGIGGTGVGKVGSVIGMAAHLEGRFVQSLDQTGLAQKFGAVHSHMRVADRQEELYTASIPAGQTDLLICADQVVATSREALARLSPERTHAVVNTHEEMPAAFIFDRDLEFPGSKMLAALVRATRPGAVVTVDATRLATALLGDSIAANLFLLGVACQRGWLPVSPAAIERALELNVVAVEQNKRAFEWGRHAAVNPAAVESVAGPLPPGEVLAEGLDEIIGRRESFLTEYQNAAYARRFRERVASVRTAEQKVCPESSELTETVARNYFKLLAYKDEYEVARLHANTDFLDRAKSDFEGEAKLKFHLSPPIFARIDPETGRPRKYAFGGWVLPLFRLLSAMRFLRGTPLDVFSYFSARRAERRLIANYENLLSRLSNELDESRLDIAIELAALPDTIRGFGPIKDAAIEQAKGREEELMEAWADPPVQAISEPRASAA